MSFKYLTFVCTLPPLPQKSEAVEYYMDFSFDGYQQRRPPDMVPIKD
jgi:hypothetical protein